jgi:hypothetical protein
MSAAVTSALPQPEALQAIILSTVDKDGSIPDTREIVYNGSKMASAEEQGAVEGVLKSLWSKEVSRESRPRGQAHRAAILDGHMGAGLDVVRTMLGYDHGDEPLGLR